MPLGNILARARLGRDMQQKDLAAAMGIARSTVSAWEKGHRTPDADQVRELCRLLHVSADVLLERAPFELLAMPAKALPRVGEAWVCDGHDAAGRRGEAWLVERLEPSGVVFRDPNDPDHACHVGFTQLGGWRLVVPAKETP